MDDHGDTRDGPAAPVMVMDLPRLILIEARPAAPRPTLRTGPIVAPGPKRIEVPPSASDARPQAEADLATVNVLTESLLAAGTDAAWGDPRPRFEIVAWARRMEDREAVWVDLYLAYRPQLTQTRGQFLTLDYVAPAGGGGDLFRLNLSLPPEHPALHSRTVTRVAYRLYCASRYRMYTDGLLHTASMGDRAQPSP